jgi:hypothetical protein
MFFLKISSTESLFLTNSSHFREEINCTRRFHHLNLLILEGRKSLLFREDFFCQIFSFEEDSSQEAASHSNVYNFFSLNFTVALTNNANNSSNHIMVVVQLPDGG